MLLQPTLNLTLSHSYTDLGRNTNQSREVGAKICTALFTLGLASHTNPYGNLRYTDVEIDKLYSAKQQMLSGMFI